MKKQGYFFEDDFGVYLYGFKKKKEKKKKKYLYKHYFK